MAKIKHNGKVYNLPRDTDKILSVEDGRIQVECKAKRGLTDYWYYLDDKTMNTKEGKDKVRSKFNEKSRTDAVNGVNRPVSVGTKIKKDYSETRADIHEEDTEEFDKAVAAFIKEKALKLAAKRAEPENK